MPRVTGAYIQSRGQEIVRARFRVITTVCPRWDGGYSRITESAPLVVIFQTMSYYCGKDKEVRTARGPRWLVLQGFSGQAKQTRSPLEALVV